jgi:hypothetical protein
LPTALNSLPQLEAVDVTTRVPSLRQTLFAGDNNSATGRPRHMITMNTMYVEDETEPAVFLFAFKPRLMAPPTTKQISSVLNKEWQASRYIRTGSCCLRTLPNGQKECSVAWARVSDDDSGFSSPEETSRDTTDGTTEEHKPRVGGDVVRVQSGSIERVSDSTQSESVFESDAVVDSSSCYTNNGEQAVYQCISSGDSIWFSSSSSSKSSQSIPHARCCERHTACYDDLKGHRSKKRLAFGGKRARRLGYSVGHGDVDIFATHQAKTVKTGIRSKNVEDVKDVETSSRPLRSTYLK